MKPIGGSITTKSADHMEENFLFTYSENEKQQNEITEANAKLIFSPKFIPVYPELLRRGLSVTEAMIFGFIDFFKSSSSNRFYFSNEQIAEVVNCHPDSVNRAIRKLVSGGYIKTSRKVKAGGGQIRFVTDILYHSEWTISTSLNGQNLLGNKNKINNNKINKLKEEKEKPFNEELNNELINLCMTSKQLLGKSFKNIKAITPNYRFWREQYSADEILEALRKSKFSEFWRDKITLEILLRQKDTKGNAVDRIGEFLALEEVKSNYLRLEDF